MNDKDIFKLWAPLNTKWVDWVRPVPFIGISTIQQTNIPHKYEIPTINYIDKTVKDTAYIMDLPGYESIVEGMGLAELGFRPIPLYNGTIPQPKAMALVDNSGIQEVLIWGTSVLEKLNIPSDALPVFLLDSNRLLRFKMQLSIFDNSWDIYDQDIPSCEYFRINGISKIVVRADKINRDLAKILYKFQRKGITIYLCNGYDKPKEYHIKKPPRKDKFH